MENTHIYSLVKLQYTMFQQVSPTFQLHENQLLKLQTINEAIRIKSS